MDISFIISLVFYIGGWVLQGRIERMTGFGHVDAALVTDGNPEAKRLYEELIKVRSYNRLIRPVKNNSEKLTVYLGLRLTQLLDVVSDETVEPTRDVHPFLLQGREESNHDVECLAQAGE